MKHFDLILKNGHVVLPKPSSPSGMMALPQNLLDVIQTDVAVSNGKIVGLGSYSEQASEKIIDCKGLHILPGLIDTQVHFREPGMTHKEDIESGSRAALLGGVTGFFEMPNTKPSTTTKERLDEKIQLSHQRSHTHFAYYSGAEPANIPHLAELEKHPHSPGIKVFLGLSTGTLLLRTDEDLHRLLSSTQSRVVFHSEDDDVLDQRKSFIRDGDPSSHCVWRNEHSALAATQRILAAAEKLNRTVHILHISTAEEMDFLAKKKKWATLEVLPQHLYLSAPECYSKYGTKAQQNPPIRESRHRERLRRALKEGLVDIVASDHAPHTVEEKSQPYPKSPSGMPGVQTLVPLMLNLVSQKEISLPHFTALMTEKPKRIFKIRNKGRIELGADADFTLVDLKQTRVIEESWLQSKCPWSPFVGLQVQGWPRGVILNGHIAMWDDEITRPHSGQAMEFEKVFQGPSDNP